ncbi:hypothetical protein [Pseudonocardia sp. H11422]|uniref:hypothetical protein n=1 Tax=Pseudonocardia sp. H11422 TaxID=2835866 RepID=UPI001BDCBEEC|nr:hypothetical protein [Pseudonocardia sp. H11422]
MTGPSGPSTPFGPSGSSESSGGSAPEPEPKAKGLDLTVNKVLAGAGAAATAAVLGSYFGVAGTVAGAAVGSVITSLGSTLYQHSLDRTRDTVKSRIKLPSGRTVEVTRDAETGLDAYAQVTVPLQRTSPDGPLRPVEPTPTRQIASALEPSGNRRRGLLMLAGGTVLIFVLGLLVVTGIEWAKGSPLSGGDSGTSVSRVLDRSSTTSGDTEPDSGTTGSTETTGTIEAPGSAESSTEATPTPSPEPGSSNPSGSTGTPEPSVELVPPGGSDGSGDSVEQGTPDQGGQQAPATRAPLVGSDG